MELKEELRFVIPSCTDIQVFKGHGWFHGNQNTHSQMFRGGKKVLDVLLM